MQPAELRIPATPALVACAAALRAADDDARVRAEARAAGDAWVEAVLEGFVLTVAAAARGRTAGRRTAATARDLADTLIGSGTRRLDREHAAGFIAFLDARLAPGPPPTIRVPIDVAVAAALAPGDRDDPRALAAALHATIDAALAGLLDAPLALLPLGLMARTAARVGRAAIASRVHGEVDRAVDDPAAAARLRALLDDYARG